MHVIRSGKVYHIGKFIANQLFRSVLTYKSFCILALKNEREVTIMMERIRYRFLMRQLRKEIAKTVNGKQPARRDEKIKTAVLTACKAYGSIV